MLEQMRTAYTNHQWVKVLVFGLLIVIGALLFSVAGGFPPWAWRFLFQTLQQLSLLWEQQGPAMLSPLAGLVMLSLSLLILWTTLTVLALRVGLHWWRAASSPVAEPVEEEVSWDDDPSWPEVSTVPEPVPQRMAVGAEQSPVVLRGSRSAPTSAWQPSAVTWKEQRNRQVSPPRQLRIVPPSVKLVSAYEHNTLPEVFVDDLTGSSVDSVESLKQPESKHLQAQSQPDPISAMRLLVGVGLDPGLVRRSAPNEDTLLSVQCTRFTTGHPEPGGLFVVADGMGGHANGQEASRLAIQTMSDAIAPVLTRDAEQIDSFSSLLKDGVHRSNLALYRRNRQVPDMMGTTITAALIIGSTAYIVNVGDSRTYLYRAQGGLRPITQDHSIVARLVEDGVIRRDEIYTHPKRNQIYRCLGEHATVEVDTFVEELCTGDVLLLCSDGLWEMVRDDDIERIIATALPHPTQISSALIQAALSRGGADNISVVVAYLASA